MPAALPDGRPNVGGLFAGGVPTLKKAPAGGDGDGSDEEVHKPNLGGLFAGGMPALKKSSPAVGGGGGGGSAQAEPTKPSLGGLFAGGIPTLRKADTSSGSYTHCFLAEISTSLTRPPMIL